MGVHGLWELLSTIGRNISIESLEGKILAIDASIWLIQFTSAMKDEEGNVIKNAHLIGSMRRILKLLYHRVYPVFVFDGKTPKMKLKTTEKRKYFRENQIFKKKKKQMEHLAVKAISDFISSDHNIPVVDPKNFSLSSNNVSNPASTQVSIGLNPDDIISDFEWEDGEIIAKNKDNGVNTDGDESELEEWNLPHEFSPEVLAALPISMRKSIIEEARKKERLKKRNSYILAMTNPSMYSQTQLSNFLRSSKLNSVILDSQKISENSYDIGKKDESLIPKHSLNVSGNYICNINNINTESANSVSKNCCVENEDIEWDEPVETNHLNFSKEDLKQIPADDKLFDRIMATANKINDRASTIVKKEFFKLSYRNPKVEESIFTTNKDEESEGYLSTAFVGKQIESTVKFCEVIKNDHIINSSYDSAFSDMKDDIIELLKVFRLPYLVAPSEAEAQCAILEQLGLVDGVVTEDSDTFLFGAKMVYKNIFKEKKYVERYAASDAKDELGVDRMDFVSLAFLLGSDYCPGIKGIGIVNALEIIQAFKIKGESNCIDLLKRFKCWLESSSLDEFTNTTPLFNMMDGIDAFDNSHKSSKSKWSVPDDFPNSEVYNAYFDPLVSKDSAEFSWILPDINQIKQYCRVILQWTESEINSQIDPVIQKLFESSYQSRINSFFDVDKNSKKFAVISSKRLSTAITQITGKKTNLSLYGKSGYRKKKVNELC